ncbi:MAG: hypothetical protein RLZZ245_2837, partial [Verrucomicrobiota bacterium]
MRFAGDFTFCPFVIDLFDLMGAAACDQCKFTGP